MEKPEEQQFAVVEMMGHRKIAGAIKQSELAPGALIRVDVFVFGLWYCGWCLADLFLFGHISYIANLFVSLFCASLSELSE